MNVLLLSTSDIEGGAARAAYRLHQGLHSIGINSKMLVQTKSSGDPTVLSAKTNLAVSIASARVTVDSLPLKRHAKARKALFSLQWLPDRIRAEADQVSADVLNLHWTRNLSPFAASPDLVIA
jgi:hypothetical protein